jgi:hypothetical protein
MSQDKLFFMPVLILPQNHRTTAKNQERNKREKFSKMGHGYLKLQSKYWVKICPSLRMHDS